MAPALLAALAPAHAAPADKAAYSLAHPTPRTLMRDLATDRPDATESPLTVDAGRLQLELSFIDFAREDSGPREDSSAYAPLNLKIGLLHNVDLQLVLAPYERLQVAADEDASGFGDTQLRLKLNLWGNDGGPTAFALMPFIKLPTGDHSLTNDHLEAGLIIPFAAELPAGFSLGLMAEFDLVRSEDNNSYELDFVHTAVLGRDIVGPLAAFIEYVGVAGTDPDLDYRATFNTGLTFALSPDAQLDAGVRLGLTDHAEDFAFFAGLSIRY